MDRNRITRKGGGEAEDKNYLKIIFYALRGGEKEILIRGGLSV